MFERLARLAEMRRRPVIILSVVFAVVAGALGSSVADRLDPYGAEDPATESAKASNQLEEAGYRGVQVVVVAEGVDPTTAGGARRIEALAKELRGDPEVAAVDDFETTRSSAFVSRDGGTTYLAVRLSPTDDRDQQEAGKRIVAMFDGEPGVLVGGWAVAEAQTNKKVESDLRRAELFAFPLLFGLTLLFFRSAVAAALPLLVGGMAIVSTFLMLRVVSEFGSVSIFALNIVTGLGLGLAIDYSLFMVSRYREELVRTGAARYEALRSTMVTAGRTVLFSSLTVAAAMASLLVFPQRFLYSMGLGGLLVALIAAAISLVVLPSVLALLGPKVNAGAPRFLQRRAERDARPAEEGFWYRLASTVMRMPGRIAVICTLVLIVLGIPFLRAAFTWVDPQTLPQDASANQVDDILRSEFPPYYDTPVQVAVRGDRADARRVVVAARRIPEAATVRSPRQLDSGEWIVEIVSSGPPLSSTSQDLVTDLRTVPGGLVAGFTAGYMDLKSSLVDHLPLMLAIVAISTFIVLFVMTGSVVLPLKQLLMNLLGLSAVFGILVLIFQDGRFEGLLGYESVGGIETTMPMLLFATVFGLSTDYGVFLLSRIKEAHDAGALNTEAVSIGLERTGRIVTAAAFLFAVAVGAFVTSELIFIKENFLGISLGVLIDATIIRALLVPSLMRLLGDWNWWAPRPLRRLHARIGVSEA